MNTKIKNCYSVPVNKNAEITLLSTLVNKDLYGKLQKTDLLLINNKNGNIEGILLDGLVFVDQDTHFKKIGDETIVISKKDRPDPKALNKFLKDLESDNLIPNNIGYRTRIFRVDGYISFEIHYWGSPVVNTNRRVRKYCIEVDDLFINSVDDYSKKALRGLKYFNLTLMEETN